MFLSVNLYFIYFEELFLNINKFKFIYIFLNKKWFFDIIYYFFIVKIIFYLGYNIFFKLIDRGFIELVGPLGLVRKIYNKSIIVMI